MKGFLMSPKGRPDVERKKDDETERNNHKEQTIKSNTGFSVHFGSWDLIIKVLMQFGFGGVICVLLILGFQGFYETHKESVQMHREELKEFRQQLELQRLHDKEMRKMTVTSIDMLGQRLEKQVQVMDLMARELKFYSDFLKAKSKNPCVEP